MIQKLCLLAVFTTVCVVGNVMAAQDKQFEAVIRHPNGNTAKVRIDARDHHDAKVQMIGRYCAGNDCIVEGPWVYHGGR